MGQNEKENTKFEKEGEDEEEAMKSIEAYLSNQK